MAIEKTEVEFFIKELLEKEIGIEEELLENDNFLRKDIGLDSAEVVDVKLAIKKKYELDINLKNDATISTIVDEIVNLKN